MRRVVAVITGVILFWGASLAHASSTGPIVVFKTSLGNIYVQLLQNDAPQTVANFLSYINKGSYNGTFFHRLVNTTNSPGTTISVLQGGGYGWANSSLTTVPPPASNPPNEFKDSNVRGTLAMALTAQSTGAINPNSATNQFFFNLTDDSSALDQQGSSSETECAPAATPPVTTNCWRPGYTVFGKVLGTSGLSTLDTIGAEPTQSLGSVSPFSGYPGVFETVPVLNGYSSSGGSAPPPADLVVINSISIVTGTAPPTVTITTPTNNEQFDQGQVTLSDVTCDDGQGAGIASCDAPAKIDTSHLGTHTFTVTATDYAGLTTTKSVHYIVDPLPGPPHEQHPSPFKFTKATQLKSNGQVTVTMRCGSAGGCHGTLSLSAGKHRTRIGSIKLNMFNGHTKRLKFKLSKTGRRMLRAGNGRLVVWLTVRIANHRPDTRKLTLKT